MNFKRIGLSAAILWIPVLIFSALANEVSERDPLPFDVPILNFLHSLATPALDRVVVCTTDLGGATFILIVTAVLAALCYRFINRRAAIFAVIATGGAAAMNLLIKALFQRQRPDLWHALIIEKSFSFPSGHAMISSALAFTVMALLWKTRWRWFAVTLGTAYFLYIGFTRLYLGVHFPSDVLAGWCVSLLWVLLVSKAIYRQPVRDESTSAV